MRKSIDDQQILGADVPCDDDITPISWSVSVCDDYEDALPRVVVTVEEIGRPGAGHLMHLDAASSRRLRKALRDALREIGEGVGE